MIMIHDWASALWHNKWAKEIFLFVVTSLTLVVVTQLQALDSIFAEGASLDALKTWAQAAAGAIGVTAARQAIAWAVAHLAGTAL